MVSETPLFQQKKNVYEGICIPRTNILQHELCSAQRVFAVSDVRKTAAPRQVCRACAGTLFIIAWEYINMSSVGRVRSTPSNDTPCVSNFHVKTGVTVTFTCLRATTLELVYESILGTFGWAHFPPEQMGARRTNGSLCEIATADLFGFWKRTHDRGEFVLKVCCLVQERRQIQLLSMLRQGISEWTCCTTSAQSLQTSEKLQQQF